MKKDIKKIDDNHIAIQISIAEGLQEFGIETHLTAEELFDVATQAFSTSLYQAVKAGVAYMAAQEALRITDCDTVAVGNSKSTFIAWINKNKLTERRVYEVMSIAKGYLAIPATQRKGYLSLGKYKAIKLASIEPEALADLAETNPDMLDDIALLSRAELASKIANLKGQLELAQSKNNRQPSIRPGVTNFTPRTEEIREECMALQLGIELNMNGLQKLFEEVNAEDIKAKEWLLQMEQIWLTAHVVTARAKDMLGRMKDNVKAYDDMPKRVMGQHVLTAAEAERWITDYSTIENRYEADKAVRQAKRDEAKPSGPGRPKGSKNKADK